VPARTAAPSPTGDNATFAAKTDGIVHSSGSHHLRRRALLRNAAARTTIDANVKATVRPDSILCACACHEAFAQPASIDWQSRRKSPSRNVPRRAEGGTLYEVAGDPPDVERHEAEEPAQSCEPDHSAVPSAEIGRVRSARRVGIASATTARSAEPPRMSASSRGGT
jgi:hypothetical protein